MLPRTLHFVCPAWGLRLCNLAQLLDSYSLVTSPKLPEMSSLGIRSSQKTWGKRLGSQIQIFLPREKEKKRGQIRLWGQQTMQHDPHLAGHGVKAHLAQSLGQIYQNVLMSSASRKLGEGQLDPQDRDESQWLSNHCMKMGDAYVIVYSVTDKVSFEKASELRIQLRRARQSEDIPIILVGNKSDLVRSREVSVDEGRACAVVFDCKFIETSAALHHNVQDLFEGIVRQIRLRKDSKEDNARRMANTKRRESIGKKAKRFLGRIVAKNNKKMAFKAKSKSCHDLSVL
ncbi:GTP-binding protein RAD [Gracilinanus agilis]|uniref:GTP-binding protein RAD n=1 Tax=Gracilinanus agilis TaxID=191870 RepID=UPI001CFDD097|nr:GTP-binding protein RAD [Gracilinanus agilis]